MTETQREWVDRLFNRVKRWVIASFLIGYALGFFVCWWTVARGH